MIMRIEIQYSLCVADLVSDRCTRPQHCAAEKLKKKLKLSQQ